MPTDKKAPKPKTVKPPVKKVKESKEQLFSRLAKVRTEKVLKAIRILGNCSNRNNYAYTIEQVEKIEVSLSNAVMNTMSKFVQSKQEQESFEF